MPTIVNDNAAFANVQRAANKQLQPRDSVQRRDAAGSGTSTQRTSDAVTLSAGARAASQQSPGAALDAGNSRGNARDDKAGSADNQFTPASASTAKRPPQGQAPAAVARDGADGATGGINRSDRSARQLSQGASALNNLGTNEAALQSAEDSAESDRVTADASQAQASDADAAQLSVALRQDRAQQQSQAQVSNTVGRAQATYSSVFSATAIRPTANS